METALLSVPVTVRLLGGMTGTFLLDEVRQHLITPVSKFPTLSTVQTTRHENVICGGWYLRIQSSLDHTVPVALQHPLSVTQVGKDKTVRGKFNRNFEAQFH